MSVVARRSPSGKKSLLEDSSFVEDVLKPKLHVMLPVSEYESLQSEGTGTGAGVGVGAGAGAGELMPDPTGVRALIMVAVVGRRGSPYKVDSLQGQSNILVLARDHDSNVTNLGH